MNLKRVLVFFLIIMLVGIVGAQDDSDLTVRLVTNAAVEDNESIAMDVVVLNDNGTTVSGLTAAEFDVSEPTASLEVTPIDRRPLALIVIVNASVGSDAERIQQTLTTYFANFYQPGDLVEFYILDARAESGNPREASPNSLSEVNEVINGIVVAPNYVNLGETFDEVLAEAQSIRAESPDLTVQTIYVAPYLNRVAEADSTRIFAEADLPFNVIQVHEAREDTIGIMRRMAENGGGLYVNNQAGTLVNGTTPLGELRTLFDELAGNRIVYRVVYRPANPAGPAQNTETLTVTTADGRSGRVEFTYEGLAESPILQIVSPPNLNFSQTLARGEAPLLDFDLVFGVTFPDGNPRPIERLEIQVLNANTGSILQYILRTDPELASDGTITESWSLSEFATVGSFTSIELVATITDSLGFEAPAQRLGSINLIAATPIPTTTPVITATPTLIPTQTPQQVAARDMTTASVVVFPLLLAIALLGLFVVLLRVNLWRQRAQMRRMPAVPLGPAPPPEVPTDGTSHPTEARQDTRPSVEEPRRNVTADGSRILGRLYVLEGMKAREIIIDREEFIIGRNINEGCHYEISEPYIHPQHCMFIYRGKTFIVRDLGGKNGTFVDERRVPSGGEVAVPYKARINITRKILVQLREPDDIQDLPQRSDMEAFSETADESEELRFRPFLQVKYPESGDIPEDYEPL